MGFALVFLVSLAVMIPALHAHIGEYDEYWQNKAKEAKKAAAETFNPNPEVVINNLNKDVILTLKGTNGTRRSLKKYNGGCLATNPIDRCWRCQPNWMENRKRLADCAKGFGHRAIGGKMGAFYTVTDPSDNDMVNPKPGTLRHAVTQPQPLWIIFAGSMTIRLNQELIMASDKTIDARGVNVHIAGGAGITIQFIQNVIIHGLHIHDIVPGSGGLIRDSIGHIGLRTRSDGDGISIFGAANLWIDHVSMSNCADGLIDAIEGSTGITISNCHFTKHNEVTKRDYAEESEWRNWEWKSEGDIMLNGAFFVESGTPAYASKITSRADMLKAKPGSYVSRLTRFTGPLDCKKGLPC
ncbi:hypothetical protein RHGRI_033638 [Rhododendron griersonianum]|uniref:Pectate lyase n=1 Tax=Rhododendron griersonianum TaxID=479676 RepID=A0AAV6HY37_9ERIC|nr:hypothetical protein RHGRI_033638 [Rhododendron griersonianum]